MEILKLEKTASDLRKYIFQIVSKRGGHLSTAFSSVEILTTLYFSKILDINYKNFQKKSRNFFLLSKGHGETLLYAILVKKKIIKDSLLQNHYRNGSNELGGHVDIRTPGVEITSGALGHGLSIGCGISLGMKLNNSKKRVFVLLGDAECSEGSIWEAALYAKKYSLNNLIAIVDDNKIGATNYTNEFTSVFPLDAKFRSFGWDVRNCNGHSIKEIYNNLNKFKNSKNDKPKILICNTIKGKGLSFLENDPSWHSRALNKNEIELGKIELGIKNEK
jgi:transketolase